MSGLPVLTYHAIGTEQSPTSTERHRFLETIEALEAGGFHGVDLEDWLARGRPDEPKGFAIAFDDGLRSILQVAEALASRAIPATIFLVTDYVGRDNGWPGQPAWVPREPMLTWSEARDLAGLGVRFGAHGQSHAALDRSTRLQAELQGSRCTIEDRLARSCPLVAYPYGRISRAVENTAATVFSAGFGTRLQYASNSENLFALSRIDSYYLRCRSALDALVSDHWRGWLERRRIVREVKEQAALIFESTVRSGFFGTPRSTPPSGHPFSFPRSPWECRPRRSASSDWCHAPNRTRSVRDGIPTQSVGTSYAVADSRIVSNLGGVRRGVSIFYTPTQQRADMSRYVCPKCHNTLSYMNCGMACPACGQLFPDVASLPDLRLASDRYLDLDADRAKAERLHAIESDTDVMGLAAAYYAITDDVLDHRRNRFLRHLAGAEARGEALADRLPRTGRVLEVGCGSGGLLVAASLRGIVIEGVDIASRWLVVARRRLTDRGLSVPIAAGEAERLPYADRSVDAIVADSLVEHLDRPERALREWSRVLRPGGRLIVWSPNRYTFTTDPHLGLWGIGWLPRRAVPTYLKLRKRTDWAPRTLSAFEAGELAEAEGFNRVETAPPDVSEAWARARPASERLPLRAYSSLRRFPPSRAILGAFGPLWELTAEAKGAA